MPLSAKVITVIGVNCWRWPAARSNDLVSIQAAICDNPPNSNTLDKLKWSPSANEKFTIKNAWNQARDPKIRVDSFKLLWGSLNIPRHSFIARLSILKRLSTRERHIQR